MVFVTFGSEDRNSSNDGSRKSRVDITYVHFLVIFNLTLNVLVCVKIGELHRNEAEFILDQIAGINAGSLRAEDSRKAIAAALRQFAVEREQKMGKTAGKGSATTS